jgi:hypothetical protein
MVATTTGIMGTEDRTMKVSELIDRLQACDLDAEILLQVDRRMFAPPTWVGIMDTADLLAEEKEYQLVISPWEPGEDVKPSSDQRQTRKNS